MNQDSPTPDPKRTITRHEAVMELASRLGRSDEAAWQAENRISQVIGYAVKQGHLKEVSPKVFAFSDLANWVREKWPGIFDDWPRNLSVEIVERASGGDSADARERLGTLDRAHQLNDSLYDLLKAAYLESERLKAENQQLRPDAEKWQELRDRNKANAAKPRK